jgi:hypothetical protein
MARAAKAATPPNEQNTSDAMAMLKARILAEMAKIPGLVPGTQVWIDALERRINNAIDGTFVLQLKNELLVELPRLATGGKGPVTRDDTDLA